MLSVVLGIAGGALLVFSVGYVVGRERTLHRLWTSRLYHDAAEELRKTQARRRMARQQ